MDNDSSENSKPNTDPKVKVTEKVDVTNLLDDISKEFPTEIRDSYRYQLRYNEYDEYDRSLNFNSLVFIATSFEQRRRFIGWFSELPQEKQEALIDLYSSLKEILEILIVKKSHAIENVDKYGARLGIGMSLSGAGTLLWGSVAQGAVPILGAGILTGLGVISLVACYFTRNHIGKKADSVNFKLKRVDNLLNTIEKKFSIGVRK